MSIKKIVLSSDHHLKSKIIIGDGLLSKNILPKGIESKKIFYFIDSKAYKLHGNYVDKLVCNASNNYEILNLKASESLKSFKYASKVLNQIIQKAPRKSDHIIAIGGGTTTDLASFISQLTLRGMPLILIPTTLLSQVDAAIGGKNGLNVNMQKNKIGSFYYPELVICDIAFLSTLSDRELCSGIAEIIKIFAVHSKKAFRNLCDNCTNINRLRSNDWLKSIVPKAISLKMELLSLDPFEKSTKRLLNFGHTFAHSFEEFSEFDITHGEAVLLGMLCETKISELTGHCSSAVFEAIYLLVSKFLTPQCISFQITDDSLKKAINNTKNIRGGNINIVLLKEIGKGCIVDDVTESAVIQAWEHVANRVQKENPRKGV